MLKKILTSLFSFFLFIVVNTHCNQGYASEKISLPKHASDSDILAFIKNEKNKDFLNRLIVEVYNRDKNEQSLQQKMCTHDQTLVDGWKNYSQVTPQSITSSQWRSILQRSILYVFTHHYPKGILNDHIQNPISTNIRKGGGDAASTFFLDADFDVGQKVGEKFTDDSHPKPVGRETAGQSYSKEDLNHIRIIYNIKALVKHVYETGTLPDAIPDSTKITSICPQG